MLRRIVCLPLACLALAAASSAASFAVSSAASADEPSRFEIMGVRLYTSAQDVLTLLYAEGVKPEAIAETVHPCALHAAEACTTRIVAPLPDGTLDVRFTDAPPSFNEGREAAIDVSYALDRDRPSPNSVRHSAEDHFGTLADAEEGTWCIPSGTPGCAADAPLMRVARQADGSVVLSLSDLGLPTRLPPAATRTAAGPIQPEAAN